MALGEHRDRRQRAAGAIQRRRRGSDRKKAIAGDRPRHNVGERVRIWEGFKIETCVHVRGIDAPEMHGKCPSEREKGKEAKAAVQKLSRLVHCRAHGLFNFRPGDLFPRQSGRLVEFELARAALDWLLDDRPGQHRDPAEHRPAEQQIYEKDSIGVSRLALTRDDGRNEIKDRCQDEKNELEAAFRVAPPALGKSEN